MFKSIIVFILYLTIVVPYVYLQYAQKVNSSQQHFGDYVQNALIASLNSFEHLNEAYHNLNESDMAYMVKDANDASVRVRDEVRYRLRKSFTDLYNDRRLNSINTFHIFDKYGNSLLRFHKLGKHDDAIILKRESLRNINNTMISKSGFEVGEYGVTYRFQYPLFYDGEFVGSYEFGMGFNKVDAEMQTLFGLKSKLFIKKNIAQDISEKKTLDTLYTKYRFGDEELCLLNNKTQSDQIFSYVFDSLKDDLKFSYKDITYKSFSYIDKDYLSVIIPLKDINGKDIGFTMTIVESDFSNKLYLSFIEELIVILLLGLVGMYLIYRETEHKKYIRNIIDTQTDILIVTDGEKIKDANRSFLDFFGVKSLDEFLKLKAECICDFFETTDKYLQKNMDGLSWIEYIKSNPDEDNIVAIKNRDNEDRYFNVSIEGFSKSSEFIVIFKDVTESLEKSKELEKKAFFDRLTNIYSRERFEHYLNERIEQEICFSLIMFDIDHFKNINDTYGHDVGDSVLKELTNLVSKKIRKDDVFARWGGEEFMIIIDTKILDAEKFAEKLRESIQNYSFKTVDKITCSFGVVECRKNDNFDTILKRVDTMLYSAKNSGRNCVVMVN